MTNHWIDIKNSDVVFITGSNAAETHPISFQWVTAAMENGAKLIHVDPRFTRTSAKADIYAPIRPGTDTAFFNGMISYILENNLYFERYVKEYTNASFILGENYSFNDGLFSGFNPEKKNYDRTKWAFAVDEKGVSRKDPTLQDPRCVFQIMRGHFKRYDVKTVSSITGIQEDLLKKVWDTYAATGKADKAGTILYALGQCQHTIGVQNIRALAMVQLLLGNIGIAGGGVNALRGESNVQGTTDIALLVDNIPGYLGTVRVGLPTLKDYLKAYTPVSNDPRSVNWWRNYDKYMVSYLKSIYPAHDAETSYAWMPRFDDVPVMDYSWLNACERLHQGKFKGLLVWGFNPAAGGANAGKNREGLKTLDWMLAVNMFQNETSEFWKGPGVDPKKVKTEVFFLPACASVEKDGSIVNSGRWLQWRYQGPDPLGDSKSDGDIILMLQAELKKLYSQPGSAAPEPILNLDITFETDGKYDVAKAAKRISGQFLKNVTVAGKEWKAGQQVPAFAALQADGSTSCGCWIWAGCWSEAGNLMARRSHTQTPAQEKVGLFPNWAYSWPANRRVLYSRASVDEKGVPWNPDKALITWDGKAWQGDVVDGGGDPGAVHPFIMTREGYSQLFGPGRLDGPLPEHYEPVESPLAANPMSGQRFSPMSITFAGEKAAVADPAFPYVCTTYRVTEQWQTGTMTRATDWLNETQPDGFCEISRELAAELGVANGEQVVVESLRGRIQVAALVTARMQTLMVQGKPTHVVGLPFHHGWHKRVNGAYDSANLLVPSVGDPNVGIPESKAFMVNVKKL